MLTLSLAASSIFAYQAAPSVQVEPYMQAAHVMVASKLVDDKSPGGWATSENLPVDLNGESKENRFVLRSGNTGCRGSLGDTLLYVLNYSPETIWFSAQDSRIDIIREAKNKEGNWKPIEYLMQSTCGNSWHRVALGSRQYWRVSLGRDKGSVTTQVRFRLNQNGNAIYSEPYTTQISANAFTLPKEYQKYKFSEDGVLAFRP